MFSVLQVADVINAMFECHVQPGDVVIKRGDDGDNFYAIDRGVYSVRVDTGGVEKTVRDYRKADAPPHIMQADT